MRKLPAYGVAVLMVGYAVGKAVFAVEGRLGFPTGPVVTAAEQDAYFLDPAPAQAFAAITGLVGAALAVATVRGFGVPRRLLLAGVVLLLAGVGSGAAVMVVDGFVGLGVGWQWYHGVVGVVVLCLLGAMADCFFRSDAGGDHAGDPEGLEKGGGLAEE